MNSDKTPNYWQVDKDEVYAQKIPLSWKKCLDIVLCNNLELEPRTEGDYTKQNKTEGDTNTEWSHSYKYQVNNESYYHINDAWKQRKETEISGKTKLTSH